MTMGDCMLSAELLRSTGHPTGTSRSASRVNADISTRPPATYLPGADAGRIVRKDYLRWASLEPAQRSALIDGLYAVYSATVRDLTRDEFETLVFGAGNGRLALFYGEGEELAGFTYARIERMEHAGRTHAVFCAGVYFRPGCRGGVLGALFGLREALRFKLRQPRTPLAYCTRSSSPAPYRLLASTMPRVYPSRKHQTPAEVEALACALTARRQYVRVGKSPWVVRSGATPRDASRLGRIEHDPDVRFYTELNPRFAEGHSLLAWVPLDAANVAGGLFRALRAKLAR